MFIFFAIIIIIIIITIVSCMLVVRLWLFPLVFLVVAVAVIIVVVLFVLFACYFFNKYWSICISWMKGHNENRAFFPVLLSQSFSISSFYSCCCSYSYQCEVVLVFLFNDLLFGTVKSSFCLYVFFFT